MNNKPNSVNQPLTIDDIINEIKSKSSDGDYTYRGERRQHRRVSSTFYRAYRVKIRSKEFDLRIAQKEMLNTANPLLY